MPSFFFRKLQLITVLLLIRDSYVSWSTRLVSLNVWVGLSIFYSVSSLSKLIIDMSQKFPLKFRLFCCLILILQLCLFRTYSILPLKFTRCSLLVVKSLNTHYEIHSLPAAEVACCKKSLVTHYKSCSL